MTNVFDNLTITVHAWTRWKQRGYLGISGLKIELNKAIVLQRKDGWSEARWADLCNFLNMSAVYFSNPETEYLYTDWFVFVISRGCLITCLARARNEQIVKRRGKNQMQPERAYPP